MLNSLASGWEAGGDVRRMIHYFSVKQFLKNFIDFLTAIQSPLYIQFDYELMCLGKIQVFCGVILPLD